ncbi:MAG: zinc transporter ZupT [Candidatus Poseidoniaceae archaeon]|jgi:zinc transporter ZupT
MVNPPIMYAFITLAIALFGGLLPVFSKVKENPERLKALTGIAAGIIIASAMMVVIPEGYELAMADEHDAHGNDDQIAGSIALVMLEVEHGDINESQAIEEIETIVGGHEAHGDEETHDDEETHSDESTEESLSKSVLHVIEEVEDGDINATTGLEEIEVLITSHSHGEEEEHDSEIDGWLLGGAILGGFVLMLLLEGSGIGHAVHEEHHDHDDEHGHDHVHHSNNGWMMVLGLTLHSATDGLAIGAAAATGSVAITATVAMAVLIHKAPAAFSLGVFSMHERDTRNESILDVVVFSLATPIMMMIAFYAFSDLEIQTIGLAMLFSAGTFLYVATVDTLPDIHNPETGRKAMLFVLLGIILFSVLLLGADAAGLIEHAH